MGKPLPVPMDMQLEIPVAYAIARLMNRGVAFKTGQNDSEARCWIKYYDKMHQFHLTLRFEGKDHITGAGEDKFDIDLYLPWDVFVENVIKLMEVEYDGTE